METFLGIGQETWITIILSVGSAVLGGIITYFAQWGLQSRIEAIRISGKLLEKRFEAYESITDLLNQWGSVIQIPAKQVISALCQEEIPEAKLPFPYFSRSLAFENEEIFLDFMRSWHIMTQTTHMWVDADVMSACRYVSWYLSSYVALADIYLVNHKRSSKQTKEIMTNFFQYVSAITFNTDYHLFADTIYKLIAKKTESTKLKTRKSSLREISTVDQKKFEDMFSKSVLYAEWSNLRLYLLTEFGVSEEEAMKDKNYVCPYGVETHEQ